MTRDEQIARAVIEACARVCKDEGAAWNNAFYEQAFNDCAGRILFLSPAELVAALPKHIPTDAEAIEAEQLTEAEAPPKEGPVAERITRLESLLNHAITELSRAAFYEDFDSQDCMDCIKMLEDEFSAVGKTSDWQTLSNLYDRLCAACGVSNEDEIDIMPIVEARLRAAPAAQPTEGPEMWAESERMKFANALKRIIDFPIEGEEAAKLKFIAVDAFTDSAPPPPDAEEVK